MKLTHTNLLNHLKTIRDEHQKELEQGNYNMNIVVGLYDKVISDIKEKFGDSDEWKEIKYYDTKDDCENYPPVGVELVVYDNFGEQHFATFKGTDDYFTTVANGLLWGLSGHHLVEKWNYI